MNKIAHPAVMSANEARAATGLCVVAVGAVVILLDVVEYGPGVASTVGAVVYAGFGSGFVALWLLSRRRCVRDERAADTDGASS